MIMTAKHSLVKLENDITYTFQFSFVARAAAANLYTRKMGVSP